jgi:hypothetical protein
MTWVSAQLMRDRDRGEFDNYGERLYVEGLMELERKKALVHCLDSSLLCCLTLSRCSPRSFGVFLQYRSNFHHVAFPVVEVISG